MRGTRATALAAVLLLAGIVMGAASPALAAPAGREPAAARHSAKTGFRPSVGTAAPVHPVLIIGIPGLRWSDLSATATPALWRLAGAGSVGSLVVSGVQTRTCPADAWLTLNSGARAAAPPDRAAGPCPALTAVRPTGAATGTGSRSGTGSRPGPGEPATVTGFAQIIGYNNRFSYNPDWGVLAAAAGPGQCATAVGPGAALALATRAGTVASYVPAVGAAYRYVLNRCPLTVVDLGALPSAATPSDAASRRRAVRAADQAADRLAAAAPAGAIVVVAGLGDGAAPHLRAIIVSGPGYRSGELAAASTRQRGLVLITDLTASVLRWRGQRQPGQLVGSAITSTSRGPLAAAVRSLIGQDTAAQVYRSTQARFLVIYAASEIVLMAGLALALRGPGEERTRRRRGACRRAGVAMAAVPAGTFLASLVPWPVLPHPALLLYALALAWAAVIALAAIAGPWRRDPFGPPGFVAAVTVAVIGVDVVTGSHLQLGTPFGLSALEAGRFYGVGNNALGVYAVAGILSATWAGAAGLRAGLRAGSRRRAVAAAGAVAVGTVIASGWPGFGAKVGGTIAMVPGFLLLLAALRGLRITPRRALIIAVSGLVLVVVFAVLSYVLPATGASDIGAFVGRVLHGGAGGILQRKINSNVHSLTETWFTPVIPVVMAVTGVIIAWPERLRLRTFVTAFDRAPLLRPALLAVWLVALLGWLADDSGVSVAAAALPIALPLAIALVLGIAAAGDTDLPASPAAQRRAPAPDRAG